MSVATKTAKATKTEIKSAAIYRCTCKSTQEVFYVVASDTETGTFYQVRFNGSAARWECQCPSAYPCKHVRAVNEILGIRRDRERARMATQIAYFAQEVRETQRNIGRFFFWVGVYAKEQAQAEENARYQAERELRDAEAYERRLAFLQRETDETARCNRDMAFDSRF